MSSESQRQLLELASSQGGFFTAAQAATCGINSTNHTYHVQRGHWQRWQRGIYRFVSLPLPSHPDLYALALFLRGRDQELQGTFGLETAAMLHEIGDFMPSKPQVIVFPGFERSHDTSNFSIRLSPVPREDWEWYDGLPVTTPLRTVLDLINATGIETSATKAAFMDARRRGLITSNQVKTGAGSSGSAAFRLLAEWEGEYAKIRKSESV